MSSRRRTPYDVFEPVQTQEYWIAKAKYRVWELAQKAHESEEALMAYQRATLTFIRNFLPPHRWGRITPLLEKLRNLRVPSSGNPIRDGDKANLYRLQLLDEINAKVTEEMYAEGLVLKKRMGITPEIIQALIRGEIGEEY